MPNLDFERLLRVYKMLTKGIFFNFIKIWAKELRKKNISSKFC